MIKIIFIFIVSLSYSQTIELSETINLFYKGNLTIDHWAFPRTAPTKNVDKQVTNIISEVDLIFSFDSPFELRIHPYLYFDHQNEDRNRFYLKDAYLSYLGDQTDIKLGYQIFSWKTVETVSPADFLNQKDLEIDFLDSEMKLPELTFFYRYNFDTDVEQSLSMIYFLKHQPTRFPIKNNRYSFGLDIENDKNEHTYDSKDKENRPQFALSYQRTLFEDIDTRWFYFNGYNRYPGIIPTPNFRSYFHEYREVEKIGMTFQSELDAWLIKGEFVQTDYNNSVTNQNGTSIKPSYLAYTIGFEYSFYSFILEDQDLGLITEFIGDSDSGKDFKELESFRPFQNHLFIGLRYAFNNASDRSILAGGFIDYKSGDKIMSIEYQERFFNSFKLTVEYFDIMADNEPISNFKHTDRYRAILAYFF